MCGRNIIRAILGASIFISVRLYGYTEPGIEFRANRGQWDPEILYRAELNNGYLLVTRKGLSYLFCRHPNLKHFKSGGLQADENGLRKMSQGKMTEDPFKGEALFLTMAFSGSPESAEIIPSEQKEGYYNYFLGNNPARWAGHVPSYGEITYRNIYPGIHFRLYSSKGFLKYDITVDPGAGVEPLKLVYEGMDSIFRQYNNIYIRTPAGEIIENRPYAYQLRGKDTVNVPCFFRLAGHTITFICPQGYNRKRPLIIDPLLVFSTYSGATMDNWGNTATYDSHGNVYSGGTVWDYFHQGSLPVTKGAFQTSFGGVWDVALLKFDSTGHHLIYGTYLGGSDTETPLSLIVNKENELVILGITGSSDYPVSLNAYSKIFSGGDTVTNALGIFNSGYEGISYLHGSDFFITRFSEDGSQLLGSTYLGGSRIDGINNAPGYPLSRNYGDEFRGEVNIDNQDNIYIISNTSSPDFPIKNGFQKNFGGGTHDAVAARLSPDLSALIWSTFIGGSDMDAGYSIKIFQNKYIVVAGGTKSYNLPMTSGSYQSKYAGETDGWLARISMGGDTLLSATYVGT